MAIESLVEATYCFHLEKRIVERISRGIPLDKRPDLVLWICHFPLPSSSGIQCPVVVNGTRCPHNGPYSKN
ncbi:MAG: hypothetical protein AB1480_02365 [Nitrospirota bacterium]